MIILTIESSCDETSVALGEVKHARVKLLSHVISSQIKLHAQWGGVVPTLAAREHLKNLEPVMQLAGRLASQELRRSGRAGFKNPQELAKKVDLIGVTVGPGLAPALLMGVNFAKSLAYIWKKPLIPINHMEAHLYTSWVKALPKTFTFRNDPFPMLALLVSGGHTLLVRVEDHLKYQVLGETLDDAAGEAFDKVARILGLGYPGGPELSQLAKKGQPVYQFSLPLKSSRDLNFSFSGLKTAVLYQALEIAGKKKNLKDIFKKAPKPDLDVPLSAKVKADLARSFENTAVESLIERTKMALARYPTKTAVLGGGVAANELLRQRWTTELPEEFPGLRVSLPPLELTGDNSAMLIPVTYLKWEKAKAKKKKEYRQNWQQLEANASLNL